MVAFERVQEVLVSAGYEELVDQDLGLPPGRRLPARVDKAGKAFRHLFIRLDPDGGTYPPITVHVAQGKVEDEQYEHILDILRGLNLYS